MHIFKKTHKQTRTLFGYGAFAIIQNMFATAACNDIGLNPSLFTSVISNSFLWRQFKSNMKYGCPTPRCGAAVLIVRLMGSLSMETIDTVLWIFMSGYFRKFDYVKPIVLNKTSEEDSFVGSKKGQTVNVSLWNVKPKSVALLLIADTSKDTLSPQLSPILGIKRTWFKGSWSGKRFLTCILNGP